MVANKREKEHRCSKRVKIVCSDVFRASPWVIAGANSCKFTGGRARRQTAANYVISRHSSAFRQQISEIASEEPFALEMDDDILDKALHSATHYDEAPFRPRWLPRSRVKWRSRERARARHLVRRHCDTRS